MEKGISKNINCPVCGYYLGFEPWIEGAASFEICPSCGTQFGHDDFYSDWRERPAIYQKLRTKWINDGMIWYSKDLNKRPLDWNPQKQLQNIPEEFK